MTCIFYIGVKQVRKVLLTLIGNYFRAIVWPSMRMWWQQGAWQERGVAAATGRRRGPQFEEKEEEEEEEEENQNSR